MEHNQRIIFTNDVAPAVDRAIEEMEPNRAFVLTDENTRRLLPGLAAASAQLASATEITIPAGDANKTVATAMTVWSALTTGGATRRSLLINLGGGVVTDLGGFAAATFKRGIRFVNVPTTLLGAVDAAVGGKTGVNFLDYKNEVGAFSEAEAVIISTTFFSTLPAPELKSGFAEMLKHGLLKSRESLDRLLAFDLAGSDSGKLLELLEESVGVKSGIVAADPQERGLRKALNLGHSAGHAFESLALRRGRPVPHGYAVAWGLIVELVLSSVRLGFPGGLVEEISAFIRRNYGAFPISCDDYDTIIELIGHDKKSRAGELNFTLLASPGDTRLDCAATPDEVRSALDIYRDLTWQ